MARNITAQTIGKQLARATGTFHVYKGHLSAEPLSIWLYFEGTPPYRLAGASDGWHLIMDHLAPKEANMQESGEIRICDMSAMPCFEHVIGQRVQQAWIIFCPTPEDIIGIRLDFDASVVRILNWGDEMYVGSELPADAEPHEVGEQSLGE